MPMYIGRFAPTPSGPLHFGSLCTAVGSYLRARSMRGRWLLRIEDLDLPRCSRDACDSILRTLEAYGLEYDQETVYQSGRQELYRHTLEELKKKGLIYPCGCSRSRLKTLGGLYDGLCRSGLTADAGQRTSLRFRNPGVITEFDDRLRGKIATPARESSDDFILRRSDGIIAYNLAVVADDWDQGVTEIVRGADLLDVTTRQLNLIVSLGYRAPAYLHLPLILSDNRQKLSKQNHAKAVVADQASEMTFLAMECLGQRPPGELRGASPGELLAYGISHFRAESIPLENKTLSGI